MSRVSLITPEKIANAVEQLFACGNADPSANDIREHLKKLGGPDDKVGAQNKIQSYLNALRVEKKKRQNSLDVGSTLPLALATEIHRALNASATQARETAENEIGRAQAEIEELVADGESLEFQIEDLTESLVCRTTERDALSGQLDALSKELMRWKEATAQEHATFVAAQVDLAQAEIRFETSEASVAALRQEALAQRLKIESLICELAACRAAGATSDRNLDAAQIRLETETQSRHSIERANKQLLTAVQGIDAAASRAASAEAATDELRAQVDFLHEMLKSRRNPRPILFTGSRPASLTMRRRNRIGTRSRLPVKHSTRSGA